MWGGTFLPSDKYLWCDGTQYPVNSTYQALYNIIGTTYGGTSGFFNVPDLRQRFPIGAQSTNSMNITLNGTTLVEGGNKTMTENQLAYHSHTWNGNIGYSEGTNTGLGVGNFNGGTPGDKNRVVSDGGTSIIINVNGSVGTTPSTQEDILPPFTVVNFIICYQA